MTPRCCDYYISMHTLGLYYVTFWLVPPEVTLFAPHLLRLVTVVPVLVEHREIYARYDSPRTDHRSTHTHTPAHLQVTWIYRAPTPPHTRFERSCPDHTPPLCVTATDWFIGYTHGPTHTHHTGCTPLRAHGTHVAFPVTLVTPHIGLFGWLAITDYTRFIC